MQKGTIKYYIVIIALISIIAIPIVVISIFFPNSKKQVDIGRIYTQGNILNYYVRNQAGDSMFYTYDPDIDQLSVSDTRWERCFYQDDNGGIYQDKTGLYWQKKDAKKTIQIFAFRSGSKNMTENITDVMTNGTVCEFLYTYKERPEQLPKSIIYCFDIKQRKLSPVFEKETYMLNLIKIDNTLFYHDAQHIMKLLPDGNEVIVYSAPDQSNIAQVFFIKDAFYILRTDELDLDSQDIMTCISQNGEVKQEYNLPIKLHDTTAKLTLSQSYFYYCLNGKLFRLPISDPKKAEKITDIPACKIKNAQFSVICGDSETIYILQTNSLVSGYKGYCIDCVLQENGAKRVEENTWYDWKNQNAK